MASNNLGGFRPTLEALEDRSLPSTTGTVGFAPFSASGPPIQFTPFSASGPPIQFTPFSASGPAIKFTPFSAGTGLIPPSSNSSSSSGTQHLNYQLQLPTGTVTFNPLLHGNVLNPGFTNHATF